VCSRIHYYPISGRSRSSCYTCGKGIVLILRLFDIDKSTLWKLETLELSFFQKYLACALFIVVIQDIKDIIYSNDEYVFLHRSNSHGEAREYPLPPYI
jgi:hypothetical protein